MAMEGDDPVENSERGCQFLYNILQSARNAAVHAHHYQQHANSLLTGARENTPENNVWENTVVKYVDSADLEVKIVTHQNDDVLFVWLAAGWVPVPELLEAFRTEFALRLLWGQSGAAGDKRERYEKFDKVLSVLSNKLEPVEISPTQAGALSWASGTVWLNTFVRRGKYKEDERGFWMLVRSHSLNHKDGKKAETETDDRLIFTAEKTAVDGCFPF